MIVTKSLNLDRWQVTCCRMMICECKVHFSHFTHALSHWKQHNIFPFVPIIYKNIYIYTKKSLDVCEKLVKKNTTLRVYIPVKMTFS